MNVIRDWQKTNICLSGYFFLPGFRVKAEGTFKIKIMDEKSKSARVHPIIDKSNGTVWPTHSWSKGLGISSPSNCISRIFSKSSSRCSVFSMWAGKWQFTKQSVCPKRDMRMLTPPLFPWHGRWKHSLKMPSMPANVTNSTPDFLNLVLI